MMMMAMMIDDADDDDDDEMSVSLVEETRVPGGNHPFPVGRPELSVINH